VTTIYLVATKTLSQPEPEYGLYGDETQASGNIVRGNADSSDNIDLSDPIWVLNFLFLGGAEPACLDSADSDDNGRVELTDAVYLLNFLFLGGPAPREPFPACGFDPTLDDSTCDSFEACETT